MDRARREHQLPAIGSSQPPSLPPIHLLAPLPAPVARPAAFAVAHRTHDGLQAYDYGDLHETASGGGYSYYSSSQTPAPVDPMFRPRPSFPITIAPQHHPPPPARPLLPPSRKFVHPPATYIAPAHPHSHHLHSIPPRDKSTRTLILDHLLWMHARARFGAARGELGVGTRPHLASKDACLETLEDHGVMGLGLFEEGLDRLSYPTGDVPPVDPDVAEELALGPPDLALAAAYRAKATGLEKVLTAMLDQTPAPEPIPDEDDMVVDSALSSSPGSTGIPSTSQKLPNSVRLRLALSLLVNELFSPEPEPSTTSSTAPPALLSLAQLAPPPPTSLVSPPSPPVTTLPSFRQFTSGAPAVPQNIFNTIPRNQGIEGPWTYHRNGPAPAALYKDGVLEDVYTQQTPRCARHLSKTCQAPACAFVPTPASSSTSRPAMILGVQPGRTSTIGAGLGRSGGPPLRLPRSSITPRRRLSTSMSISPPTLGLALGGTGPGLDSVAGGRLTALVSRFLRISALVAIELGREARGEEDGFGSRNPPSPPSVKIPNTNPYLPANSSGSSTDGSDDEARPASRRPRPRMVGGRAIAGRLRARAQQVGLDAHARPTRVWYALLCGLVTRACLEGYLVRGWKSTLGAEILFRVGVKPSQESTSGRAWSTQEERDLGAYEARERALAGVYDPDEMPSLDEAGRILFARGAGEEESEWEREVHERLVEFTTVPHDAPNLGAHLENLATKYPAEPVERAALRFCESVARWRGKPELETYKRPTSGPSIPIDQLINIPMTATPKPPIERYFHLPVVAADSPTPPASRRPPAPEPDATPTNSKRPRAHDEAGSSGREAKKANPGQGYIEVEGWVGPYGV